MPLACSACHISASTSWHRTKQSTTEGIGLLRQAKPAGKGSGNKTVAEFVIGNRE